MARKGSGISGGLQGKERINQRGEGGGKPQTPGRGLKGGKKKNKEGKERIPFAAHLFSEPGQGGFDRKKARKEWAGLPKPEFTHAVPERKAGKKKRATVQKTEGVEKGGLNAIAYSVCESLG